MFTPKFTGRRPSRLTAPFRAIGWLPPLGLVVASAMGFLIGHVG